METKVERLRIANGLTGNAMEVLILCSAFPFSTVSFPGKHFREDLFFAFSGEHDELDAALTELLALDLITAHEADPAGRFWYRTSEKGNAVAADALNRAHAEPE